MLAATFLVGFAGCGAKSDDEGSGTPTENRDLQPSDDDAGDACSLDALVQGRIASDDENCSALSEGDLPDCVETALDDARGAYWISERRPATDSLLQYAILVDEGGNVELIDWDSDPTGSASYAPSATIAPCATFEDDMSLSCDSARGANSERETLCAFGVRISVEEPRAPGFELRYGAKTHRGTALGVFAVRP